MLSYSIACNLGMVIVQIKVANYCSLSTFQFYVVPKCHPKCPKIGSPSLPRNGIQHSQKRFCGKYLGH